MAKKDITTPEELIKLQDTRSVITESINDDRDLVNQLLGQAQMADAFSKFSKTVLTSKMAFVKESKLYQSLKGKKSKDGLELSGTWAEFCNLLGYTPEHANESIANLKDFGGEALESMSKMGIGYRELRQFRKLPEDEKQALIEAAKEGDKESIADIAETIIAKQAKEKESLAKELEDVKLDLEASRETTSKKESALTKTENELEKLRFRIKDMSPSDIGEGICKEAAIGTEMVLASIAGTFRKVLKAMADHQNASGIDYSAVMAGLFIQVSRELNRVKAEFNIPDHFDDNPIPDWDREESMDNVRAALGIEGEE